MKKLLLALYLVCTNSTQAQDSLTSKGTLVVSIPTKDGYVICADRRRYNKIQGAIDDETKIFQLSPKVAFAFVGARHILDRKTFEKLLDNANTVVEYFADKNMDTIESYWDDLRRFLAKRHTDHILQGKPDYEDEVISKDVPLYTLIFYYIDKDGKYKVSKIDYQYIKQPNPHVDLKQNYPPVYLKAPASDGQNEVVGKLIRNDDERFSDLTRDPVLQKFKTVVDPQQFSQSEAIYLAKYLIKATHERIPLVSDKPVYVSLNCDCAILNSKEGFKWIFKNQNATEVLQIQPKKQLNKVKKRK